MKKVFITGMAAVLTLIACSKNENGDPGPGPGQEQPPTDPIPYAALPQTQASFQLSPTDAYLNSMGNTRPPIPSFVTLTKQPGKLRGYVKNTWGKPLAGAYIGIRSSTVGGVYTAASDLTDNNGYYEIQLPFGAVHFFAAGYSFDYSTGIASQGLYPADGIAEDFASAEGAVENFVFLPYGTGEPAAVADRPWYPRNYFGGSLYISYAIFEDMWSEQGSLPANSEIEITLTPDEWLLDARERKTFIIRKKVGNLNFYINNIPVGRYHIKAKLVNGAALKLKATDFTPHPVFGMKPTVAVETATILFKPYSAAASSGLPYLGGWDQASIKLQLP